MNRTMRRWLWGAIPAYICYTLTLTQAESGQDRAVFTTDETAVRALAQDFYDALARKDLDAVLRLWSEKSPELSSRRETTQKLFAGHEKIELKSLAVRKATIKGDVARLRVDLDLNAIEARTGKPAGGYGRMEKALDCVKEGGRWKLWRERPAAEDFAETLLNAKTETERSQLVANAGEPVSVNLLRAVLARADAFQQQGDYPEALAAYRLLQTLAEPLGDPMWSGAVFNGRGKVYASQGNYLEAAENFRSALKIAEQVGQEQKIAASLNNLGLLHAFQGDFDSALGYLQRSLAISQKLGNKLDVGRTLGVISEIYRDRGAYGLALESVQKSLLLSEAGGDREVMAFGRGILGGVYKMQGNYPLAYENYQKALTLHREAGNKYGVASTEANIGKAYFAQGDLRSALEYQQRALAQFEALGIEASIAEVNDDLGAIQFGLGNHQLALEYHRKAVAQCDAIGNKTGATSSLSNLSIALLAAGRPAEALAAAERATTLARETGVPEQLWWAHENVGHAHRALNHPEQARRAYEESIAIIEALRAEVAGDAQGQERFFEDKLAPYHAMVEMLASQNQPAGAFAFAQRAKARALLDVLRSGRFNIVKAMNAAEQTRERELTNRMVSLNTQVYRENQQEKPDPARLDALKIQLQKTRLDFEDFQTSLYVAHPELKARRGETPPLTLEQARDLLPDPQSALLEYVVTQERTYLFVFSRNAEGKTAEIKVYPLEIKRKELVERAARFRATLASGSPGFRGPARDLYDLLLKPAAAQLWGKTSLIIAPDGALWELPFQALLSAPGRYLIDDCAIDYAPSLTALREMQRPPEGREKLSPGAPTLLAFGNPSMGKQTIARAGAVLMSENLAPLPEAERQVKALQRIYGAQRSKIYTGAEAREERAKKEAGAYRILHLATHGVLNNSSPMYSYMLLAQSEGDQNEDGLLEAWEIMKLDLNADLAVLTACETARGRVGAGEGMIGLAWALFVAGCPTTVASQWKVESASATVLMLEFHRRLNSQMAVPSPPYSAARAMRDAALKLRRTPKYRHPFYWAGFVVAGKGF
jgi:CHAT domain-containing protein